MVSTRSVAVAPSGSSPCSLKPTTRGMSMLNRLAEHRGLGLDAADAPAQHAQAVDHGGVRVGADAGVGVGERAVALGAREDHAGQVLDVDLVDDAGARRDDLELVERGLAPAQELVALAVALVLDLDVALEGVRRPKTSAITEWSMTSSAGASGLILCRVAAELGHRPRAWWPGRRRTARR